MRHAAVKSVAASASLTYDTSAPNTAALNTGGDYNSAGFPANLTGTTSDSGTGGSGSVCARR